MEAPSLYVRDGDGFVGTVLTQGSWDPGAANGGAVLALLGQCLDEVPSLVPMSLARLTADLVRPVPIGRRLHVVPTIRREGKKIQVVELQLLDGDVEHVRVTALRLRDADLSSREDVPASTTDHSPADALTPIEDSVPIGGLMPSPPGFMRSIDMRRAERSDGQSAGTWIRLMVPIVAGEPVSDGGRMAYAFDFANLIGMGQHIGRMSLINPDVTAQVLRPPSGEWVAVTGDTRFNAALGRGVSSAALSDLDGVFAVASTSQLVQPLD
ncbi:MAG TPA: thioesterase family protein [Acidimicrobiales bacterium]